MHREVHDERPAAAPGATTPAAFTPPERPRQAPPEGESEEPAFATPAGFTPQALLEGHLPELPPRELAALLCHHVRRLLAVEAHLDLALGAGLRRLRSSSGHVQLGASTFESYCTSVLGFSAPHASEVMRLEQRLAVLPKLAAAFRSGAVGRSRLRVVLPHARPEQDAALCRTRSVRSLARLVASGALAQDAAEPRAPATPPERDELDAVLHLSMTEAQRALLWLQRRRLHVELGHASFGELVQHRFGLGPREATEALELQSKLLLRCSRLAEAFRSGELPAHVVSVLRLVARRETEAEWITHAKRCCWKRLLLEVDLLLALRGSLPAPRWEALTRGGRPLAHLDLPSLQLDFQEALGGHSRRRRRSAERVLAGRRGVCMAESVEDCDEDGEPLVLTWERTTLLRVAAPAAVARLVREALEGVKRRLGVAVSDGSALVVMLREFLVTYSRDPNVSEAAWKVAILERDGCQCAMPHCRRRSGLEVHHVVYRSHVGPDEPWNLLSLCSPCHRHLQHAGRVRITGRVPETVSVTWGEGPWKQTWRHGLRVA